MYCKFPSTYNHFLTPLLIAACLNEPEPREKGDNKVLFRWTVYRKLSCSYIPPPPQRGFCVSCCVTWRKQLIALSSNIQRIAEFITRGGMFKPRTTNFLCFHPSFTNPVTNWWRASKRLGKDLLNVLLYQHWGVSPLRRTIQADVSSQRLHVELLYHVETPGHGKKNRLCDRRFVHLLCPVWRCCQLLKVN